MKNFKDFLAEKHMSNLYHGTSLELCTKILKNKHMLTSHLGLKEKRVISRSLGMSSLELDEYIENKGIVGYVSFARHPNNLFTDFYLGGKASAILMFESVKLSKYGKIIPVDYHYNGKDAFVIGGGRRTERRKGSEQEERLLSTSKQIPLKGALKKIALVNSHDVINTAESDQIKKLSQVEVIEYKTMQELYRDFK